VIKKQIFKGYYMI